MPYVRRLVWDAWNVTHIARHEVIPDEVEEICHGEHIEREAYRGRIMLIGSTGDRRVLAVVLEPVDENSYYPVTARPASRRERRIYQKEKGGGT